MKVKHLLFALLATVFLGACSKEDVKVNPKVSFEKSTYVLTKGSVDINLKVEGLDMSTLTADKTIAVKLGGDAVKGQDYTISTEAFVLSNKSAVKTITITAKDNYDTNKKITLTLEKVEGYDHGKNTSTTVNLGKKDKMLYSFVNKSLNMSAGVMVDFQLLNSDGSTFVAEEDITIPVSVNTEKSTAVEGTHFAFDGEKSVVIPTGKNKGTVKLKYIEPLDPEKNIIVLKADLEDKKGYVKGQYTECKVIILGSYADKIFGEWVMNQFVTDKKAMDATWFGGATFTEANGFPVFNQKDKITIGEEGFVTNFESSFKNYFGTKSDVALKDELVLRTGMGAKVTLQLLELNNINRYFSATEKSDDDTALIGVRVTEEGLLDVYVIDYESKSFAPEFIKNYMYGKDKPVATMTGVYLNFTMKKVQ